MDTFSKHSRALQISTLSTPVIFAPNTCATLARCGRRNAIQLALKDYDDTIITAVTALLWAVVGVVDVETAVLGIIRTRTNLVWVYGCWRSCV